MERVILDDIRPVSHGVKLSWQEEQVLKLPPDFCIYQKLTRDDFDHKLEAMNANLRYKLSSDHMEEDGATPEELPMTDEEKERIRRLEAESEQFYQYARKDVNLQRGRNKLAPE